MPSSQLAQLAQHDAIVRITCRIDVITPRRADMRAIPQSQAKPADFLRRERLSALRHILPGVAASDERAAILREMSRLGV